MAKVGYAIVTVILVSGLFSFWQEYCVEQTLAALRKLLPQQAQVLREGKVARVPAEQLVPGDILHLEQGDTIPADCRLIEAFGARVNKTVVTGESLPKARDADPSEVDDLIDSKNVVLAGTSMVSGQAKAVVFATGMHTEFGKIAHLTQTAGEEVSPLRKEIAHLSRLTAILAVLIGLSFFSLGWMIGIPFWKAFIFAIGIIVAMVPEGLLPTLTLALVLATQRMAKRNVLIRYQPSVEMLGSTTVICTDKTGTLTQNHMDNFPIIRLLPGEVERDRWLTREEADRLLAVCPEHLAALIRFALATGCRAREITGLEWNRVDLQRKTAWLNQTKNGTPRGVPLNRDAVAVLEEQLGKNPQYCFTYRGQPIRWDVTNTAWHTALRNAGIQDFRFHDLRHTWASWHRQAGTSCDELKDLGGWKSRTMVDRYAKFATDNLRVAASRIKNGLGENVLHLSRFCHGQNEKRVSTKC